MQSKMFVPGDVLSIRNRKSKFVIDILNTDKQKAENSLVGDKIIFIMLIKQTFTRGKFPSAKHTFNRKIMA